ncbi:uncharacterized protein LOC113003756 [Solenopsis invicta]|uniref:uncharacterized protein LOC113003756 n=1 Tax=Solenopsis invicta TaxID=13686 RepID=UPI00193D9BE2|nr:uncharacterized protein LOC113003756 [Solenopsis invicta]
MTNVDTNARQFTLLERSANDSTDECLDDSSRGRNSLLIELSEVIRDLIIRYVID